MAPVQNTFSIIPDLPSAINGNRHGGADGSNARPSRPPMTTKQVKKAYQKANKGPKLSKAEQRRQELFEQDRIRKELEKEKSQARARAARDKKREREQRERAEKKKKGLPLVDVRPSQDTIARFVQAKPKSQRDASVSPLRKDGGRHRGVSPTVHNAAKPRQFDDADKENVPRFQKRSLAVPVDTSHGLCDTSPIPAHAEPPDKKRRIEVEEDQMSLPIADGVALPPPTHDPIVSAVGDRLQGTPSPDAKQSGLSSDDNFSPIDLSEENFGDLLREIDDASRNPNVLGESLAGQQQGQDPPPQCPPPKPPEDPMPFAKKTGRPPSCLERAARPTASLPPPKPVLSSKPVPGITEAPRQNPIPEPAKQGLTSHSFATLPTLGARRSQPIVPSSRSFRHPKTPMALPPASPRLKLSEQVATGRPSTSRFLKSPSPPPRTAAGGPYHSRMAGPKQAPGNELPPSTQLFLLSHFDDFLPSPSQEARELFEEPQEKHAGNVNITESTATHINNQDFTLNQYMSKMPTTTCNASVNSTPGINPRGTRHVQQIADRPKSPKAAIQTPIQPIPQHTAGAFEIPFFSTQDLLLSSQDVKDIEEEPLSSPKPRNPTPIPTKDYAELHGAPRRALKPFFTSSCRELRYKYALERSRTAAWEGPSARQKAREELDRLQVLEDERLEALLADPSEETENGNTRTIAVRVELDAAGKGPFTARFRTTPTPQVRPHRGGSGRNPYSISENTAQKHTRMFSDVQRSKPGSSGSSYEAMLELLAKAPKQKPDTHVTDRGTDGDGDQDRSRHANSDQTDASRAMMTIPASQETDYDCGEEWDDDDLLCDML
ncbi:hypothetical protein F4801DRAFT_40642 [Xylaria longipes]|nr:hypothetical protein F4801DRAFT_40642 [Xylaria longipes]